MAVNVTEKDKTLNEIIDWCENHRRKILADIEPAPGEDAEEAYADLKSVIRSDNPICRVHPLRRNGGHILRDLPVLRIQAGCAQSATKGEMYGLTQVTTD